MEVRSPEMWFLGLYFSMKQLKPPQQWLREAQPSECAPNSNSFAAGSM